MYISLSQSSSKDPVASFIGPMFKRQRKQAGKVYEHVLLPLFDKKELKSYYMKLVNLVGWLVLMDTRIDMVVSLAKKLNSYVLYHKNENSM